MAKVSLVGPSYVFDSLNYDAQRCVNWYTHKSESGTSRDEYILLPTPGRVLFSNLSNSENRGCWQAAERAFFVAGNKLYEVYSNGTNAELGTITTSYTGNVSMSDNGQQLCIVDGTATGGWILDLATNVFTQITDPYFLGAVTVVFLGGYFVFNKPNSSVYYISAIYDGLTGDPTEFAVAEGSPDELTNLVVLQNQVYLMGSETTEVVYNSGDADFPLTPLGGAFSEFGTKSPFGNAIIANALFFLGADRSGNSVVYKFNSYNPDRISTYAIESILKKYDITKATAYTYQEKGHYFYVLNIDGMPTTLVYDIGLNMWHERCYFNPSVGTYTQDRAKFHLFVFGKHLVGDYENGNIYEQSLDYNDDNGVNIRRMRTMPYIATNLNYIYFSSCQIDIETGVGAETGNNEDVDPQIYLDWSDDNAHTFKSGRTGSIGKLGEYLVRVVFRMLGRGRTRVFRILTSTKQKCYVMSVIVNADEGAN